VVIVSYGDPDALASCVGRRGEPCHRFGAEIVIVVHGAVGTVAALLKVNPGALVAAAPADLSREDVRGVGLLEATGDIVAFTDECETRGEEWIAVLERRARNAGSYGPSPNGTVDWARYLEDRGLLSRDGTGA
jgi:hypothetical protein